MERVILHCDCNGFFASVECALNPKLKTVPMAVCGDIENRHGIILAKNELAKKYQIKTAETVWQAKRKCPNLVLVPPHHSVYQSYSQRINQIYQEYTDQVEPFGIDESWLDVTQSITLFGNGETIANALRARIKQEFGITISVGVSFNKIFAKLGSDYKKPDATTIITSENFKQLLFPLPVSALLYVGHAAEQILNKFQIKTIGDLANANPQLLKQILGKQGNTIYEYANGFDTSPVKSIHEKSMPKSISHDITFSKNLVGLSDIRAGILPLAESVATRLKKQNLVSYTISVSIKNTDLRVISKQKTLPIPTNLAKDIIDIVLLLIQSMWNLQTPIRMLSIGASNLIYQKDLCIQTSIFEENKIEQNEKQENLEQAIDEIREKYGSTSITRASNLNPTSASPS